VDFSLNQLWTLQGAFDEAETLENGYTLAAIVWKESSAGVNLYRSDSEEWDMKSYGPFQILMRTAASRRGCDSPRTCRKVKTKLLKDFKFSAALAKEELIYWENRLGNKHNAIAAYNAGKSWRYNQGQQYLKDILKKAKYLKHCVRFTR
jgi:hypothetical protein